MIAVDIGTQAEEPTVVSASDTTVGLFWSGLVLVGLLSGSASYNTSMRSARIFLMIGVGIQGGCSYRQSKYRIRF